MIQFYNVSKIHPRTGAAVTEISFHLRKGEFAFLTGHSGAGKSTILKLIHFQTRPTKGELQVLRYHTSRTKRRQIPNLRRRVGFVFQDFKLLEGLTAAENVAFALKVTGSSRCEADRKVERLLNQVSLSEKAKLFPSELSAGEKQRVVIARALATDPLLLLADEPTGNLDAEASEEIFQLFWMLHLEGMAVVMATHNTELVHRNPGVRVLELKDGQLISDSVTPVEPISSVRETNASGSLSAPDPTPPMLSESNTDPMAETPEGSSPDISHDGATSQRENT
jgi:cell division transport system ATP-binding protein